MIAVNIYDETMWRVTGDGTGRSRMSTLFATQTNINKMAHYIPVYDAVFKPFSTRPVKMLELGVAFGGSLELWRRYFWTDAVIVGVDVNPSCAQFGDPDRGVHVRIGAQQDRGFLAGLVDEFGEFDIILDDASHVPSWTNASFDFLFTHGLADGGVYLVEDLFGCYLPKPFCDPLGEGVAPFMDTVKTLIDTMHVTYPRAGPEWAGVFEVGHPDCLDEFEVPLATVLVSSIEVHDSIVVIRRGPRQPPRFIRRWSHERLSTVCSPQAADQVCASEPWAVT